MPRDRQHVHYTTGMDLCPHCGNIIGAPFCGLDDESLPLTWHEKEVTCGNCKAKLKRQKRMQRERQG